MDSPFIIIIFGATGDLARNKLIPALFSLFRKKELGPEFYIIGFARREMTDKEFRSLVFHNKWDQAAWARFSERIHYQQGLFEEERGYRVLIDKLNEIDKKTGACITRVFYLATPPNNYETILDFLSKTKLSEGCGQGSSKWTRLAIEKPFGKDLESAKALDEKLSSVFSEKQIFRVDHYLAKETVQNMVAFRFANGIFEPVWNSKYIDHVQITWAEKKGIGDRGRFFDGVGLLRDVGQNHLMQLIASVAMEQPKTFEREDMRSARANVIKSIRCIREDQAEQFTVRGQYEGFTKEKDVEAFSETETFAAMKLFIDTPRFLGVPFYIRAGKKMPKDTVEISIVFKQTCHILFKEFGCPEIGNVLTIKVQPDEGISIRMIAKKPGARLALEAVNMNFTYEEAFTAKVPEAHEKILLDIFAGDQMLFNRSDELRSSWGFITKILKGWEKQKLKTRAAGKASGAVKQNSKPKTYLPETWGPEAANELIEKDGRKWL
ncbi:MAG: glucose-6-phosphate dehydrogenase [Patescibacteria group bacterium]|nr:glucose-6-phosphate dehydrogenase [Patescibacteria group bacterium]